MSHTRNKYLVDNNSQNGAALVELAVVSFLLIILVFGGIELVRGLNIHAELNSASRQIAVIGLRECADAAALDTCAETQINILHPSISTTVPAARIMMSVWKYDSASNTCNLQSWGAAGIDFTGHDDQFNKPNLDVSNKAIFDVCQTEGTLVMGEALSEYVPIVAGITKIFGFDRKVIRVALLG